METRNFEPKGLKPGDSENSPDSAKGSKGVLGNLKSFIHRGDAGKQKRRSRSPELEHIKQLRRTDSQERREIAAGQFTLRQHSTDKKTVIEPRTYEDEWPDEEALIEKDGKQYLPPPKHVDAQTWREEVQERYEGRVTVIEDPHPYSNCHGETFTNGKIGYIRHKDVQKNPNRE